MEKKKAKALIYRPTEEYGAYISDGVFGTCDIPYLYPLTFTLEGLKEIVKKNQGIDLDTTGWYVTIVEIEMKVN